jgi:hypothetical protein
MVDLYGGADAYSNSEWNNWNISANAQSDYLHYSDGSASPVTAILSYNESLADNSDSYGGGMAPAEVLRHTSYSDAGRKLYIANLNPASTYSLELYASRAINPGNSTAFTTGGSTVTVSSFENLTSAADFSNLQPNSQGQIVVNIASLNTYNYLNGFVLRENGQANTEAANNPGMTIATPVSGIDSIAKAASLVAVQAYPNPVTDHLTLEVSSPVTGAVHVELVDQQGAVLRSYVFDKELASGQFDVYTNGLAAGVYFIRVRIGSRITTQKVIKW